MKISIKEIKLRLKSYIQALKRLPKATYLCWKYPFLKFWYCGNKFFQTSCWYYCIPDGWRKAFGIQMINEIKASLKRNNIPLKDYNISDIKEKWGILAWYDYGAPVEVHKIIHKYEEISMYTCIVCGRLATVRTTGWICPYCDDCVPKKERFIHFGHKNGPKWYGLQSNIDETPKEIWEAEEKLLKRD